MKILSIDIGYQNPGIVIIERNKENVKLKIYQKIKFNVVKDSIPYLDYFFSQKIDYVVVEKQISPKNISLMQFINGYCSAKNIKVIIKNPISTLRPKVEKVSRSEKKKFSVLLLNEYIYNSDLEKKFLMKDSDICDAVNIGISFLYDLKKGDLKKDLIKITEIKTVQIHI